MRHVSVVGKRPILAIIRKDPFDRSTTTIETLHHVTVNRIKFSSLAGEAPEDKHCPTCKCSFHDKHEPMPAPLPDPMYSVLRRALPSNLTALSSPRGRQLLLDALSRGTAESYLPLTEHFQNQSDPAFCGLTTLLIILNSMLVDPHIRWRGGWRYFGDEDVLLSRCCFSAESIRRMGISMDEFCQMARCQGLSRVVMKRPSSSLTLQDFRRDVQGSQESPDAKLVVSFSRPLLGQTGDGHFSPVAGYHEESDSVLIMDVARFKYPPYWASLHDVYEAMIPMDEVSKKSRGWVLLEPPQISASFDGKINDEHRRPANLVRQVGQPDICPIGKVKVEFCKSNQTNVPSV